MARDIIIDTINSNLSMMDDDTLLAFKNVTDKFANRQQDEEFPNRLLRFVAHIL